VKQFQNFIKKRKKYSPSLWRAKKKKVEVEVEPETHNKFGDINVSFLLKGQDLRKR
jgi:hypothetical protein